MANLQPRSSSQSQKKWGNIISGYLDQAAFVESFGRPIKMDDVSTILAQKGQWIIIGDFNAIRFLNERKGNSNSIYVSEEFNLFVDHHQLVELKLNQLLFTWSNHHDSPSMTKLDGCLVTTDWIEQFLVAMPMPLPKTTSNHFPLKLEFYKHPACRKPLRFKLFWLLKHDLKYLVGAWWKAAPNSPNARTNLVMKLDFLRRKFKT
ncbi:uncharacterized protein [Elaeis guineensis]|uniref:uncharacterized protein n=1 Tax=Elaeis guineensis var. tenera TaxID=51953 RepID=UPI003C6D565B